MIKKIVLGLLLFIVLVTVVIFGIRLYNGKQNEALSKDIPKHMKDPGNMANYPLNVEGIKIKKIDHQSAQGFHMVPDTLKHKGVLVVYGGSEGSPYYDQAVAFAKEGYEVVSMFMFGQKHQPKTLVKVPLEQFDDVLSYIDSNVTNKDTITVVGASKGAEYALNLATKYKEINHVILIAPSAYVFSGLDFKEVGSSWSYQGKELPYVDLQKGDMSKFLKDALVPMLLNAPVVYKTSYDAAVAHDKNISEKTIPAKDTKADLLVIAGSDDQMWNSAAMAKKIKAERPAGTTVKVYDGAGHIFAGDGVIALGNMAVRTGGKEAVNKAAFKDSQKLMKDYLSKWHTVK